MHDALSFYRKSPVLTCLDLERVLRSFCDQVCCCSHSTVPVRRRNHFLMQHRGARAQMTSRCCRALLAHDVMIDPCRQRLDMLQYYAVQQALMSMPRGAVMAAVRLTAACLPGHGYKHPPSHSECLCCGSVVRFVLHAMQYHQPCHQ